VSSSSFLKLKPYRIWWSWSSKGFSSWYYYYSIERTLSGFSLINQMRELQSERDSNISSSSFVLLKSLRLIKEIVGSMIEGVRMRIIIILRIEVIVTVWIRHMSLQLELLIRIVIELIHSKRKNKSNEYFDFFKRFFAKNGARKFHSILQIISSIACLQSIC